MLEAALADAGGLLPGAVDGCVPGKELAQASRAQRQQLIKDRPNALHARAR
jgi:hypothetical protein